MAAFSAFARITPETQAGHNIKTDIEIINTDACIVRVESENLCRGKQSAWLITSGKPIPPEKQNFRNFIWSEETGDSPTLKIAKLPCKRTERHNTPAGYIEVTLKRANLKKTYIYIDYPQMIFDGGYYYCIDLWTYCKGSMG